MKLQPVQINVGRSRTGATAVEFALVAPVLFLFVLAGIEFSRANLIVHSAKIAAVEGARQGIIPGANAEACRQEALSELSHVNVNNASVQVTPSPITDGDDTVTVRVAVPATLENGFAFTRFLTGKTLEYSVTLIRETADFGSALPDGSGVPPPPADSGITPEQWALILQQLGL